MEEHPSRGEYALIDDAMSIKQSVYYNKSTGNFDGYVNFGDDGIVVSDENLVAKEALVFMLLVLKGIGNIQWGTF